MPTAGQQHNCFTTDKTDWCFAISDKQCSSIHKLCSSAFVTMALAWQVAQLQSDLDAAYRDCFLQTSRDLSDKLASPLELQSISEASFGDLGRTKPEVCIDQCQCSLFWLSCLKETSAPVPVLHVVRLGRPVASSSRIDAMSAFKAMSTCDSVLSPFSACARACQR